MFNSLGGDLSGHDFPFLFLQTGGIEWQIEVSAATFQSAISAPHDRKQRLFTYLYVREDILKVYGFWYERERRAFLELLSVAGIGPKQALKILSGTNPDALVRYIDEEDVDALVTIPGLGKKMAQRLILQLKGHLVTDSSGGGGAEGQERTLRTELVDALTEMGFDRKRSETALDSAMAELGVDPTAPDRSAEQEIFRRAIVALSGS